MVSQTSVRSDLLESLQVVSELLVDGVGKSVRGFTVDKVLLPVEEPRGDLELGGVLHDGDNSLELIRVEFSSSELSALALGSRHETKEGMYERWR